MPWPSWIGAVAAEVARGFAAWAAKSAPCPACPSFECPAIPACPHCPGTVPACSAAAPVVVAGSSWLTWFSSWTWFVVIVVALFVGAYGSSWRAWSADTRQADGLRGLKHQFLLCRAVASAARAMTMLTSPLRQPGDTRRDDQEASQILEVVLRRCRRLEEERERQQRCLTAIQSIFGDGYQVEVYGSGGGLYQMAGSDIDVSLKKMEKMTEHLNPTLCYVRERLEEDLNFSNFTEVPAKVPILKFRFESILEVDFSYDNWMAVRNTRLLERYSELDPNVCDTYALVKLWAGAAGVLGTQTGYLSSYAYKLLVIYYMQHEVNLPCLSACEVDEVPYRPTSSLNQSLIGFFRFYAEQFAWGEEVVTVRLGTAGPQRHFHRSGEEFSALKARTYKSLLIEDPYQVERSLAFALFLHTPLGKQPWARDREGILRRAIETAFDQTRRGKLPVGLKLCSV